MKKAIYIILFALLGLIFSFILHAIVEIIYLNWAERNDVIVSWTLNQSCTLPLWLIVLLPILGIVSGIWLGFLGWKKIYVEKIRGDNPKFLSS